MEPENAIREETIIKVKIFCEKLRKKSERNKFKEDKYSRMRKINGKRN